MTRLPKLSRVDIATLAKTEDFFSKLNPGDLFIYAHTYMGWGDVRVSAERAGVKVEYCGPQTPEYQQFGGHVGEGSLMPRQYDYDADDIGNVEYCGKVLGVRMAGKLEMSYEDYFGTKFQNAFTWLYGQFEACIYDTARMDEIFRWVDDNAQHPWYWNEMSTNHGHSVVTSVYFSDDADKARFAEKWGTVFERKEYAEKLNADAFRNRQTLQK